MRIYNWMVGWTTHSVSVQTLSAGGHRQCEVRHRVTLRLGRYTPDHCDAVPELSRRTKFTEVSVHIVPLDWSPRRQQRRENPRQGVSALPIMIHFSYSTPLEYGRRKLHASPSRRRMDRVGKVGC